MKDKIISLFIVCLMLAGCATWVDVGGQYEMSSQNFSIDLPEGWRRYNLISDQLINGSTTHVTLTRKQD